MPHVRNCGARKKRQNFSVAAQKADLGSKRKRKNRSGRKQE